MKRLIYLKNGQSLDHTISIFVLSFPKKLFRWNRFYFILYYTVSFRIGQFRFDLFRFASIYSVSHRFRFVSVNFVSFRWIFRTAFFYMKRLIYLKNGQSLDHTISFIMSLGAHGFKPLPIGIVRIYSSPYTHVAV
jgi:hypothetical protein